MGSGMDTSATRQCSTCGVEKSLADFVVRKTHRPGKPVSQCTPCKVAINRARRQADPKHVYEIERKSKLKRVYGITAFEYDQMLEAQGNACAICGAESPGERTRYFAVDHCHATGAVRGLLCTKCNRGIGLFNDNIDRLEKAVTYLKRSQ